jgi:hypothetical protein
MRSLHSTMERQSGEVNSPLETLTLARRGEVNSPLQTQTWLFEARKFDLAMLLVL